MSLYEVFDVGISGVSFVCSVIAVIVSVYTLKCSGKANSIAEKSYETAEKELREVQKEHKPEIRLVGDLKIEIKSRESLEEYTFDFESKLDDCYTDDTEVECITLEIENCGKGILEKLAIKSFNIGAGTKDD